MTTRKKTPLGWLTNSSNRMRLAEKIAQARRGDRVTFSPIEAVLYVLHKGQDFPSDFTAVEHKLAERTGFQHAFFEHLLSNRHDPLSLPLCRKLGFLSNDPSIGSPNLSPSAYFWGREQYNSLELGHVTFDLSKDASDKFPSDNGMNVAWRERRSGKAAPDTAYNGV